jgi:hypothetical protein
MRFHLLLMTIFATIAPPLWAADYSESHLKAAKTLMDLTYQGNGPEEQAAEYVDMMMKSSTMPMLEKIAQEKGTTFICDTQLRQDLRGFVVQALKNENVAEKMQWLYAKHFTEEELHQMIGFYKSPVGKKAIMLMPTLFQQGAAVGQQAMTKHAPKLQQALQRTLTDEQCFHQN